MNKTELIKLMISNHIITTNFKSPKTLKNGDLSPIYFDLRSSTGHPEVIDILMNGFYQKMRQSMYDVIMGVAVGALPFSERLADRLKIPSSYVRPNGEKKSYGLQKYTEGASLYKKRVFLIEDVAHTGKSILKDRDIILNNAKAESVETCSIFSYETKELYENFKAVNLKPNSIITMQDVLSVIKEHLPEVEYDMLLEWVEDPKKWYNKYRKTFITIPR